jgi:hypothetical protein
MELSDIKSVAYEKLRARMIRTPISLEYLFKNNKEKEIAAVRPKIAPLDCINQTKRHDAINGKSHKILALPLQETKETNEIIPGTAANLAMPEDLENDISATVPILETIPYPVILPCTSTKRTSLAKTSIVHNIKHVMIQEA